MRRLGPLALALIAVLAGCGGSAPRPASHSGRHGAASRSPRAGRGRTRQPLPPAPADVRGARARRMPVPILMYHVIGTAPPGAFDPDLWVPRRTFASELRALRRAGYHAVALAQVFAAWRHGGPLPRRPVVVSFDDGYLPDYRFVRPLLRRLGWPGVLNLELNNVRRGDLTAAQVRGLLAAGWEVDSHTLTHPDLTTVPPARLHAELFGSRRELRRRFGVAADFFCYPGGRYDARVLAAVRAAGYLGATTTREGYAVPGNRFTLARVRVHATDTAATLLARLAAERPPALA